MAGVNKKFNFSIQFYQTLGTSMVLALISLLVLTSAVSARADSYSAQDPKLEFFDSFGTASDRVEIGSISDAAKAAILQILEADLEMAAQERAIENCKRHLGKRRNEGAGLVKTAEAVIDEANMPVTHSKRCTVYQNASGTFAHCTLKRKVSCLVSF